MPDEEPIEAVQVPLVWLGVDETPVFMANQVLAQVAGKHELVLSFGQVTPPPLLGTPEERAEQAKRIDYVSVRVVARVSVTPERVKELQRVLEETLANYDKTMEALGD